MVKSLKDLQNIDIEKMAKAIEVDAGMPLPELRQALEAARQFGYIELESDEHQKIGMAIDSSLQGD